MHIFSRKERQIALKMNVYEESNYLEKSKKNKCLDFLLLNNIRLSGTTTAKFEEDGYVFSYCWFWFFYAKREMYYFI